MNLTELRLSFDVLARYVEVKATDGYSAYKIVEESAGHFGDVSGCVRFLLAMLVKETATDGKQAAALIRDVMNGVGLKVSE